MIPQSEHAAIIAAYEGGETFRSINIRTGFDFSAIRRIVHAAGVNVRLRGGLNKSRAHRKYTLNEAYFESVDTERKAWMLGFVSSDGNVYKDHRLTIGLAWKDKEILDIIAAELECTAPVTQKILKYKGEDYPMAHFNFASLRLANSLRALGVVENKSLILVPWNGPADLMPHYWRGMIDGDGCLHQGKQLSLVGNFTVISAFANYCSALCGTQKQPYKRPGNGYSVAFGARHDLFLLVSHFYSGATISLARKWALAKQIITPRG